MGHVEHTVQVRVDAFVPLLRGHFVEGRVAGDARVVDQNFNRSKIALDLFHTCGTGIIVGDVPFIGLDTGFGGESCGLLIIAGVSCGHFVACILQRGGNGCADTARAACYECNTGHGILLQGISLRNLIIAEPQWAQQYYDVN
jgi:hypothetical protein